MCLMVKEGQYPPPPPKVDQEGTFAKIGREISTYARECFVHPLFVMFYIFSGIGAVAAVCGAFNTLFLVRHVGFSTKYMGLVGAALAPLNLLITVPAGWLVDRLHPMRVTLIASTALVPLTLVGFFLRDYIVAGVVI